ncbi:RimK family alpha-L-glutamate ligase [Acidobacteriota bacterium]
MGLYVFPNTFTAFHFDDKVAQKSLLEGIDSHLVPTWVFYSKEDALSWAKKTSYPKVFKLRRGAASTNVKLVKSQEEAFNLIQLMFKRGISPVPSSMQRLKQGFRRSASGSAFGAKLMRLPKYFFSHMQTKSQFPRERGYAYFQEYLRNNQYDIRVTIIGNRAFAFRRQVRPGDFRASGSGRIEYYNPGEGDLSAIEIAFDLTSQLKFQAMAFDFLIDHESGERCIVELSYVFDDNAVFQCPGYFNRDLKWYNGHVWPQDAILEDVITALNQSC